MEMREKEYVSDLKPENTQITQDSKLEFLSTLCETDKNEE